LLEAEPLRREDFGAQANAKPSSPDGDTQNKQKFLKYTKKFFKKPAPKILHRGRFCAIL
jgi:hypothetical protein